MLKKISYIIFIILSLLLIGFTFLSVHSYENKPRLFAVRSGSMEPAIKTGAVVLVWPESSYKESDIITFKNSPTANLKDLNATTTHRIVKVMNDEGRTTFQTKGDANEDPDYENVAENLVIGKVLYSIPYLGRVVGFAKTQAGFIILVIIPATIIIYSELMSIKDEIKKKFRKSEKPKDKDEDNS